MSDQAQPIYNERAECAVLGACLIDSTEALPKVYGLTPRDFYLEKHGMVFEAMRNVFLRDGEIDLLVLADHLEGKGQLKDIGGSAFLTLTINATPTALGVEKYARIVKRDADRRHLLAIGAKAAKIAYDGGEDATLLYDEVFAALQASYPVPDVPKDPATWAQMDAEIGPIEWAWDKWLPQGFLTILAGEPGIGKSILTLRLCACFLGSQAMWPDSSDFEGGAGSVLWCEAEAAQSLNLERAKGWGLPIEHILSPLPDPMVDISLDNPAHRRAIEAAARRKDVLFVVVDSLSGASRKDENSSDTLSTVHWLAELARDSGKPILITHHLRKRGLLDGDQKVSLERLRGYSGIVQPARLVWALDTPDPQEEETKRLSVIKSNLGRFPEPLGLQINDLGVIFCDAPEPPKTTSALDEAKEALMAMLEDGATSQKEIKEALEGLGISFRTASRAKKALGAVSKKEPDGWYWALPSREQEPLL